MDMHTYYYAYTVHLLRSSLLRKIKLVLDRDCLLEMLSAVVTPKRNYPAMLLAKQLVHQRFVVFGPLVQEHDLRSFIHPKEIGSILSYDVLNPTHVPL